MAMARRERLLALTVGVAVALYAGDALILTPFLEQQKALAEMRLKDRNEATAARDEHRREAKLKSRIQSLATEQKDAERQLLGAITEWARETGVTMSSVKPEYVDSKKQLKEVLVQAAGSGKNENMVRFLYKLHAAKFPLRVIKTQLGTRTNDSEELTLNLRVSTLYLGPEPKKEAVKKDNGKKVADSR